MIPLSVLDLSPILEGSDAAQSFRNSLDLAQHAERWGYHRFWLAEHHGMPGIASAATAVLIGHVAGGTSRIRVGAGGIMLPNHSSVPNCSAITSGEWLGSMMPPAPTRIRDVPPATWPISTAVAALAMPGMPWCSASQKRW